jgi:hypothetical protein
MGVCQDTIGFAPAILLLTETGQYLSQNLLRTIQLYGREMTMATKMMHLGAAIAAMSMGANHDDYLFGIFLIGLYIFCFNLFKVLINFLDND